MLRPIKSLTALLVGCLFLFTFILVSTTSTSQQGYYTPRRPSSLRASLNSDASCGSSSSSSTPVSVDIGLPKKQEVRPVPTKVTRQVKPPAIPITPTPLGRDRSFNAINNNDNQEQDEDEQYLMYVPYAGVTNQLISIWHGSLIAKALNRTLLIPNLSPNVHVEPSPSSSGEQRQEPATTKWSEFFDLDEYARRTGVKIEELDTFLERRGIVDQSTVHPAVDAAITKVREESRLKRRSQKMMMKKRSEDLAEFGKPRAAREDMGTEQESQQRQKKTKRTHKKRWIQFESLVQQSNPIVSKSSSPSSSSPAAAAGSQEPESNQPFTVPTVITSTKKTIVRPIRFPTVQKCFSEAGYGTDRRIDMTGRRFMQRYNIDPTLTPTPFLDPLRDNGSIWSRWRMDKVIERYQQPQYAQEEILCLGHVYRLLPGGNNRVWTEFGQYFRYTERVEGFVDQILDELLPKDQDQGQDQKQKQQHKVQPFVGLHLRRGDFYRHCLGITSPADPNGWNRCYPSTEHIISLLDSSSTASTTSATTTSTKKLPVLVLTNEHDPKELAKADAQHWIRVDHANLGTLEKFGRYGPILIDGALLARASLLVGVEYSTYFRTASKRAETWHRGQTLFVT
ncbi:MAG: hypothetical protein JOS17DRAFT_743987 [Linnemannia elongata]|nr:MAG: hypothetical protein JOS17DRAFT_743987 [Linnemannia elongata]